METVTIVIRIRPSELTMSAWILQESFRDLYRKGQLEGTEVVVEVPSPKPGGGNITMVGLPDVSFQRPESTTAVPSHISLLMHLPSRTVPSYAFFSRCRNASLSRDVCEDKYDLG